MPSTDFAEPLLRIEYRRANVGAFWAIGVATLFVVIGLTARATGVTAPWQTASAVAAAVLVPGIVWRPWFEKGIWLWNGSTHFLARFLSAYILRVTYWLILAPLGASRSSLDLNASGANRSKWIERGHDTDTDADRVESVTPSLSHRKALGQGLRAFVGTSGKGWAAGLFPLMVLLDVLRVTRPDATPPGSTYTLY